MKYKIDFHRKWTGFERKTCAFIYLSWEFIMDILRVRNKLLYKKNIEIDWITLIFGELVLKVFIRNFVNNHASLLSYALKWWKEKDLKALNANLLFSSEQIFLWHSLWWIFIHKGWAPSWDETWKINFRENLLIKILKIFHKMSAFKKEKK